jgi:hypothetical protein
MSHCMKVAAAMKPVLHATLSWAMRRYKRAVEARVSLCPAFVALCQLQQDDMLGCLLHHEQRLLDVLEVNAT